ncbi:MAG: DUF2279 domain-containing protein [Bacteroidia bacterium]
MRKLIFFFLLISIAFQISAQRNSDTTSKKQTTLFTKKNAIVAGLVLQQAGSFIIEYQWWWKNEYHTFYFLPDGWFDNYSLGVDKVGHFYTSYLYFNVLNELMKWGEFSDRTRIITSVALPFIYALSIEIGDGYSTYGFSYEDLTANSAGILLGVLQDKIPVLQNFTIKWSYFPSPVSFDTHFKNWKLTDDYDGHIYWLSADVHNLLPHNLKKFWPAFLNIAGGYGVDRYLHNVVYPDNWLPIQRKFFIGFDFNLSSIKTKSKSLNGILRIVDKYKFPAPGFKRTGDAPLQPSLLMLN